MDGNGRLETHARADRRSGLVKRECIPSSPLTHALTIHDQTSTSSPPPPNMNTHA